MDFWALSIVYYTKGRKLSCYTCYGGYIVLNSYMFFSRCNAHMRALQSIEQGGIHHPTLDKDSIKHFDSIAMCYAALEDADNFQKWMERVSEARSRINPKQKLVFGKWLSNPVTFPVWGWRRAFCEGDESSDSDSDFGLSTCVNMGMFDSI